MTMTIRVRSFINIEFGELSWVSRRHVNFQATFSESLIFSGIWLIITWKKVLTTFSCERSPYLSRVN